jgi:hypothetical protein
MPATEVDSAARKLLERLVDLRRHRGRSQTDAAAHFHLGPNGRQTISAWELGHTIPPRERRPEFITYFCDFLGLGDDPDTVEEYWQIVQGAWHWEPLTEQERQAYCRKHTTRGATIPLPRRLTGLRIAGVITSVLVLFIAWTLITHGRTIPPPAGQHKVFTSNPPSTCYGGAEEVTVTVPAKATTTTQHFRKPKTSRCHDINVKFSDLSQPLQLRAVGCTEADYVERTWSTFFPPYVEWTTISQQLKVDSCFYLEIGSSSKAAYTVRFYVAY